MGASTSAPADATQSASARLSSSSRLWSGDLAQLPPIPEAELLAVLDTATGDTCTPQQQQPPEFPRDTPFAAWLAGLRPEQVGATSATTQWLTRWYLHALATGRHRRPTRIDDYVFDVGMVDRELGRFILLPNVVLKCLIYANCFVEAEIRKTNNFINTIYEEVGDLDAVAIIFVTTVYCHLKKLGSFNMFNFSLKGPYNECTKNVIQATKAGVPVYLSTIGDDIHGLIYKSFRKVKLSSPYINDNSITELDHFKHQYSLLDIDISTFDSVKLNEQQFALECIYNGNTVIEVLSQLTCVIDEACMTRNTERYAGLSYLTHVRNSFVSIDPLCLDDTGVQKAKEEDKLFDSSSDSENTEKEMEDEQMETETFVGEGTDKSIKVCGDLIIVYQNKTINILSRFGISHYKINNISEYCVSVSNDRKYLALALHNNEINCLDLQEEKIVWKTQNPSKVKFIGFITETINKKEKEVLLVVTHTYAELRSLKGLSVFNISTDIFNFSSKFILEGNKLYDNPKKLCAMVVKNDKIIFETKKLKFNSINIMLPKISIYKKDESDEFTVGPYSIINSPENNESNLCHENTKAIIHLDFMINYAGYSSNADSLLVVGTDTVLVIRNGVLSEKKKVSGNINGFTYSPDGKYMVVNTKNGLMYIINTYSYEVQISYHSIPLVLMCFVSNNIFIYCDKFYYIAMKVINDDKHTLVSSKTKINGLSFPSLLVVMGNTLKCFNKNQKGKNNLVLFQNNKIDSWSVPKLHVKPALEPSYISCTKENNEINNIINKHSMRLINVAPDEVKTIFEGKSYLFLSTSNSLIVYSYIDLSQPLYMFPIELLMMFKVSPDEKILVITTINMGLFVISLETGKLIGNLNTLENIYYITFGKDKNDETLIHIVGPTIAYILDLNGEVLKSIKIPLADFEHDYIIKPNEIIFKLHKKDEYYGVLFENLNIKCVKKTRRNMNPTYTNLPILQAKDEFISRLKKEKVLIVTAETGSGKTTQLPQYCADNFNGLVLVTQPRALAASSLAKRVALEYDGEPSPTNPNEGIPGNSVGYIIRGKQVPGDRIIFLTDAGLISYFKHHNNLAGVSVLIIDEAHERSLNTDIAIGLSKLALAARNDFHVVIASATIDPKPFINFYGAQQELKVPGRTFPVTVEYKPVPSNKSVDIHMNEVISKALDEHKEGDCLVFMTGVSEIQRAMNNFKKYVPKNCTMLPLHGQLQSDDQHKIFDKNYDGGKRKVIFCTNIAETSLTVERCKLVIDLGKSKEADYDPEKRITKLVEKFVSKSSADQRKGRAGRVSEGHCIRLYSEEDYNNFRPGIVPEIERSSLDDTILHLIDIKINPLKFPFIASITMEKIQNSIKSLDDFGYIKENKLTEKGKDCCIADIDTRLFHFITVCSTLGNHYKKAIEIASILSGPGNILFSGTPDQRSEIFKKRVKSIEKSDSDLEFLLSVYDKFKAAKNKKAHAVSNDLNYKVINSVAQIETQFSRNLAHMAPKLKPKSKYTFHDALGIALADAYPENIIQILVPTNPGNGAYILSQVIEEANKCTIDTNSILVYNKIKAEYCVGMNIFTNRSNVTFISNCVGLDKSQIEEFPRISNRLGNSIDFKMAYSEDNVGPLIYTKLLMALKKQDDQLLKFSVVSLDNNYLTVVCEKKFKNEVHDKVAAIMDNIWKHELEVGKKKDIITSNVCVNVKPGLVIDSVELQPKLLPIKNYVNKCENSELKKFVLDKVGTYSGIIENVVGYQSGNGMIQFKKDASESDINTVKNIIESIFGAGKYDIAMSTKITSLSEISTISSVLGNSNMRAITNCSIDFRKKSAEEALGVSFKDNKLILEKADASKLTILYNALAKQKSFNNTIASNLGKPWNGVISRIYINHFPHGLTGPEIKNALLTYFPGMDIVEQNDKKGFPELQCTLSSGVEPVQSQLKTIVDNLLLQKQKNYVPAIFIEMPASSVHTGNANDVVKLEKKFKDNGLNILYKSSIVVDNFDKFLETQTVISNLKTNLNVNIKIEKGKFIVIEGPSYEKVLRATKALSSATKPFTKRYYGVEYVLIEDLNNQGILTEWAKEIGGIETKITKLKDSNHSVTGCKLDIYGDGVRLGTFINNLLIELKGLSSHSIVFDILPDQQYLLRQNGKLRQLEDQYKTGGTFIKVIRSIVTSFIIYKKLGVENFLKYEQLKSTVMEIMGYTETEDSYKCVFCGERKAYNTFSYCGHAYCKECLINHVKNSTDPICCEKCNRFVSLNEIQTQFNLTEFSEILEARLLNLATTNDAILQNIFICPSCGSAEYRNGRTGFLRCNACGKGYCSTCNSKDKMHEGLSCEQYKSILKGDSLLDKFYISAEQWARANWSDSLPPMAKFYPNESLKLGCMSLQRFAKSTYMEKMIDVMSKGKFVWHGTRKEVIPLICRDGFDPSKRSGQAYGPGEYFAPAHKLNVSYGYSRDNENGGVIVSYILNVGITSSCDNYCYVVGKNPLSWEYSYCIPIGVATWGSYVPTFITNMAPKVVPFYPVGERKVKAPVNLQKIAQWYWDYHEGTGMTAYKDDHNSQIEMAYYLYKNFGGNDFVLLRDITRYLDDQKCDYLINFSSMKQTNSKTQYARTIERRMLDVKDTGNFEWQYLDDKNMWVIYDREDQLKLNTIYDKYLTNKLGENDTKIHVSGRPELYFIDLTRMKQINTLSKAERDIRRVEKKTNSDRDMNIVFSVSVTLSNAVLINLRREAEVMIRTTLKTAIVGDEFEYKYNSQKLILELGGTLKLLSAILAAFTINYMSRNRMQCTCLKGESTSSPEFIDNLMNILIQQDSTITKMALDSRKSLLMCIAKYILYGLHLEIYGSFVRDFIIQNKSVTKINVRIPHGGTANSYVKNMEGIMRMNGINSIINSDNKLKQTITIQYGGKNITIKFVDCVSLILNDTIKKPYVDADVNDLIINSQNTISFTFAFNNLSLEETLGHLVSKQFVFFLDYSKNNGKYEQKILKLLGGGYKCISEVPGEFRDRYMRTYPNLFEVSDMYKNMKWELSASDAYKYASGK